MFDCAGTYSLQSLLAIVQCLHPSSFIFRDNFLHTALTFHLDCSAKCRSQVEGCKRDQQRMRRGIGVSAIKNRQNDREKYAALGKELEVSKLSSVRELLSEFQEALMQFATKHRTRINSDPEFRLQFHAMCRNAGVDPLASNRGIWANVLGIGDFYFELGIVIIEICLKVRAQYGGLISVADLLDRIRSSAKGGSRKEVSSADINRAVEKISVLGNGFRIVQIMGNPMVLSLPMELNKDHEDIINEAQDEGFVNEQSMSRSCGWSSERFNITIRPLLQDGIVWLDIHKGNSRSMGRLHLKCLSFCLI